jgi:hypothetical protein
MRFFRGTASGKRDTLGRVVRDHGESAGPALLGHATRERAT